MLQHTLDMLSAKQPNQQALAQSPHGAHMPTGSYKANKRYQALACKTASAVLSSFMAALLYTPLQT
jgi:hypothetical protein